MYEESRSEIARAIVEYLRKNPHAQDTLAGIAEWWLPQQRIKTSKAKLKEVLADLVTRGLILESKGKDLQIHYRINDRKLDESEEIARRKRSG
jgi:hypothetical protein